jgi:hypothetical protein
LYISSNLLKWVNCTIDDLFSKYNVHNYVSCLKINKLCYEIPLHRLFI